MTRKLPKQILVLRFNRKEEVVKRIASALRRHYRDRGWVKDDIIVAGAAGPAKAVFTALERK